MHETRTQKYNDHHRSYTPHAAPCGHTGDLTLRARLRLVGVLGELFLQGDDPTRRRYRDALVDEFPDAGGPPQPARE